MPAVAAAQGGVWDPVAGSLPASKGGEAAPVQPERYSAFTLDQATLDDQLADAPAVGLRSRALARGTAIVVTLPTPSGDFQRFELQESPIMEAGLAAQHPEIKTYAGRGLDNPAASIRADNTPLGFHASVRSPNGSWYVDPYYRNDDSVYISYYGRDVTEDTHGDFVEKDLEGDDRSARHRRRSTCRRARTSRCGPTGSR